MTNPIDPGRPGVLEPAALALMLEGMSDEALRGAEEAFRLAAEGWQVRVGDGDFIEFSNRSRLIPAAIAQIIARYRRDGTGLLSQLEELASDVEHALRRGDALDELEATWLL